MFCGILREPSTHCCSTFARTTKPCGVRTGIIGLLWHFRRNLVAKRLTSELFERAGQPVWMGEIAAGVASVLLAGSPLSLPLITALPASPFLEVAADFSIFAVLLLAGVEMHPRETPRNRFKECPGQAKASHPREATTSKTRPAHDAAVGSASRSLGMAVDTDVSALERFVAKLASSPCSRRRVRRDRLT